MIDLIFEEKGDRVNTILLNIFHTVVAHTKDRKYDTVNFLSLTFFSPANFPQAIGALSLMSSFSEYSYAVRAWRKDVLDIFYENDFFYLNQEMLTRWKVILDAAIRPSDPKVPTFMDLIRKQKVLSSSITLF